MPGVTTIALAIELALGVGSPSMATPKKSPPKKISPKPAKKPPAKKPATKKPAAKKPVAKKAPVNRSPSAKKRLALAWAKKVGAPPTSLLASGEAKKSAVPRAPVTKRVIAKSLAKTVEKAEPALRRGSPQISSFGHARHLQGGEAKMLQSQILSALAKSPRSFQALEEAFPMITENQLRYQLVMLRTDKKVVKVGAREATVYKTLEAR